MIAVVHAQHTFGRGGPLLLPSVCARGRKAARRLRAALCRWPIADPLPQAADEPAEAHLGGVDVMRGEDGLGNVGRVSS